MSEFADNIAKAEKYLRPFQDRPLEHFINGRTVAGASGRHFDNICPADNRVIGQVARGDARDVDAACNAAWAAFPGWRDRPAAEKKAILHRMADLIEARAGEIALLESMDSGQPIRFMEKAAARGAANLRFFADRATEARNGRALPAESHMNFTSRRAIGPVGVITPWNTPFMLSTWKIAPALAAGCTIVHKPAEWSPVTALLLAEIATEAGLPDGVWNMVQGLGEEAGRALSEHPHIKAIAFVGETTTGRHIMAQGAPTLKRVHFELGGKNPVVVFDDADMARALDAVIFMIYSLNGQRCTSGSRLLVQKSLEERFVTALAERVRKIKYGHPLDPATEVGPLIHRRHQEKVLGHVTAAREAGATVAVGGDRPEGALSDGNYVIPALVTGVRPNMRIAREEIFGPVLSVLPFEDEADALAQANDSPYGLAGYIWTRDIGRALRLADRMEVGMVWINSENQRHLQAPFGGAKDSGIGRDGGDYSFDFYMETKNTCLALDDHAIPRLGK